MGGNRYAFLGFQILYPLVLGSHSLDTLRWIFGDEVKRVYAVKRKGILEELGVDTEDIYLTTIEFEHGGIAQMENGWITPNGNTNVNDYKFSVLCTKGMINMDLSSHNLIQEVTEENTSTPDILVSNRVFDRCKGLSYESIRDFIDRLVDGRNSVSPWRMPEERPLRSWLSWNPRRKVCLWR